MHGGSNEQVLRFAQDDNSPHLLRLQRRDIPGQIVHPLLRQAFALPIE